MYHAGSVLNMFDCFCLRLAMSVVFFVGSTYPDDCVGDLARLFMSLSETVYPTTVTR